MYNMIPYKSRVMHVEDDTLMLYPIIYIINAYPRLYNKCGDDSSMVILDDEHLCDTITVGNTYIRSINVPESRY